MRKYPNTFFEFLSPISWGFSAGTKYEKVILFGFSTGTKCEKLNFYFPIIHNSPLVPVPIPKSITFSHFVPALSPQEMDDTFKHKRFIL
jgi:hypothetical protein